MQSTLYPSHSKSNLTPLPFAKIIRFTLAWTISAKLGITKFRKAENLLEKLLDKLSSLFSYFPYQYSIQSIYRDEFQIQIQITPFNKFYQRWNAWTKNRKSGSINSIEMVSREWICIRSLYWHKFNHWLFPLNRPARRRMACLRYSVEGQGWLLPSSPRRKNFFVKTGRF